MMQNPEPLPYTCNACDHAVPLDSVYLMYDAAKCICVGCFTLQFQAGTDTALNWLQAHDQNAKPLEVRTSKCVRCDGTFELADMSIDFGFDTHGKHIGLGICRGCSALNGMSEADLTRPLRSEG